MNLSKFLNELSALFFKRVGVWSLLARECCSLHVYMLSVLLWCTLTDLSQKVTVLYFLGDMTYSVKFCIKLYASVCIFVKTLLHFVAHAKVCCMQMCISFESAKFRILYTDLKILVRKIVFSVHYETHRQEHSMTPILYSFDPYGPTSRINVYTKIIFYTKLVITKIAYWNSA